MSDQKVRENRLRRVAERRGMKLLKSRRRDPDAIDFGGFMLVDAYTNAVIEGATHHAYSASLDDIETVLSPQKALAAVSALLKAPIEETPKRDWRKLHTNAKRGLKGIKRAAMGR
jgi:hypothetical protein